MAGRVGAAACMLPGIQVEAWHLGTTQAAWQPARPPASSLPACRPLDVDGACTSAAAAAGAPVPAAGPPDSHLLRPRHAATVSPRAGLPHVQPADSGRQQPCVWALGLVSSNAATEDSRQLQQGTRGHVVNAPPAAAPS